MEFWSSDSLEMVFGMFEQSHIVWATSLNARQSCISRIDRHAQLRSQADFLTRSNSLPITPSLNQTLIETKVVWEKIRLEIIQ